jgi:hypothetical protein
MNEKDLPERSDLRVLTNKEFYELADEILRGFIIPSSNYELFAKTAIYKINNNKKQGALEAYKKVIKEMDWIDGIKVTPKKDRLNRLRIIIEAKLKELEEEGV